MQLTKTEIPKMIATIETAVPEAFNYKSDEQYQFLVELWFGCFKSYPKELVWRALQQAVINCEYSKQNWLAAVNKEIKKICEASDKSVIQLWSELKGTLYSVYDISRDLRYSQYHDEAEAKLKNIYDGLSGEIKLYVTDVPTLIELSEMDDEALSFEKARFIKQLPVLIEHGKNQKQNEQFLNSLGVGDLKLLKGNSD